MKASTGVAAIALATMLSGSAMAAGASFVQANPGWQLEYFGRDVVVLRTTLSLRGRRAAGLIVLSCDAAQRRLRITLPQEVARLPSGADGGIASIRISGRAGPRGPGIIARYALQDGRILTFSGIGPDNGDAAIGVAGLLRARPAALEILLREGQAPLAFTATHVVTVAFSFDRNDVIGFEGFVSTCAGQGR